MVKPPATSNTPRPAIVPLGSLVSAACPVFILRSHEALFSELDEVTFKLLVALTQGVQSDHVS